MHSTFDISSEWSGGVRNLFLGTIYKFVCVCEM